MSLLANVHFDLAGAPREGNPLAFVVVHPDFDGVERARFQGVEDKISGTVLVHGCCETHGARKMSQDAIAPVPHETLCFASLSLTRLPLLSILNCSKLKFSVFPKTKEPVVHQTNTISQFLFAVRWVFVSVLSIVHILLSQPVIIGPLKRHRQRMRFFSQQSH